MPEKECHSHVMFRHNKTGSINFDEVHGERERCTN